MQMDLVPSHHSTIMLQELSLIVGDYIEQQELTVIVKDIMKMVIMLMDSIEQLNGMQLMMKLITYHHLKLHGDQKK